MDSAIQELASLSNTSVLIARDVNNNPWCRRWQTCPKIESLLASPHTPLNNFKPWVTVGTLIKYQLSCISWLIKGLILLMNVQEDICSCQFLLESVALYSSLQVMLKN